jgi:hypothetical protein
MNPKGGLAKEEHYNGEANRAAIIHFNNFRSLFLKFGGGYKYIIIILLQ